MYEFNNIEDNSTWDYKCEMSKKSPIVKLYLKCGVMVDVFHWSKENKLFIWPYCYGGLDLDKLLPLSKKE